MNLFGGKSKDSESSSKGYLFPLWAFALIFFFAFASKRPELIALPVFAILMSPIWIWMRNRHELNKLKVKAISPEEAAKTSRTDERIANLEALICRLDTELNRQMERSLISTRFFAAPALGGASSTPTSLLSLAAALDSR